MVAIAPQVTLTNQINEALGCSVFIVTVPTPITPDKLPDLSYLKQAARDVGSVITQGSIIVFESTVFPGATEEICVPIIEKASGLIFNSDFSVGYSPERINPGDKQNTIDKIVKVVSASNGIALQKLNTIYSRVTSAGTYCAPSIKVAEAAKVIENTQRDLNIALVNELSKVFATMSIDTMEVINAASTKWNFVPFVPGLVGGHCIGVDPYYLTFKAEQMNYRPELILAGRRINDTMPEYISEKILKICNQRFDRKMKNVLVLGVTFKANCPDTRNSKNIELINELKKCGFCVDACDPWFENRGDEAIKVLDINKLLTDHYDIIVIAVEHNEFIELGAEGVSAYGKKDALICDLKSIYPRKNGFWRL